MLIKIGTVTINTFLPKRNKFVYSYSINIHALGFDKVLEIILCFLLVVDAVFPTKSRDAQEVLSQLVRGQVNMADEAKLCSPIRSTFEVLVVLCVVRCCPGEEWGPFC